MMSKEVVFLRSVRGTEEGEEGKNEGLTMKPMTTPTAKIMIIICMFC